MTRLAAGVSGSAFALVLLVGEMSAATLPVDLSRYRDFHFGMNLPAVAKQTGVSLSEAKVIHSRPALIQELAWRPQSLGWSSRTEPVQEVVFSFYNGELFQIAVTYDRNETEGLTNDDIVATFSATYGMAVKPPAPLKPLEGPFGDQQEVLARWQDPQHRLDLLRSSYGPTFRLIGVLSSLDAQAQSAILEAKRLDEQEAPQRDAARLASEEEAAKVRDEKARLVNKPNFRP